MEDIIENEVVDFRISACLYSFVNTNRHNTFRPKGNVTRISLNLYENRNPSRFSIIALNYTLINSIQLRRRRGRRTLWDLKRQNNKRVLFIHTHNNYYLSTVSRCPRHLLHIQSHSFLLYRPVPVSHARGRSKKGIHIGLGQ